MPREICERAGCVNLKLGNVTAKINEYEFLLSKATGSRKIEDYEKLVNLWSTQRTKLQKYTVSHGFCQDCPALTSDFSTAER